MQDGIKGSIKCVAFIWFDCLKQFRADVPDVLQDINNGIPSEDTSL